MADAQAFALKESVKDFAGGTIAVAPNGHALDVKARLDNNNGVIVTSDDMEIAALTAYPALKSVPVPTEKATKRSDS